MVCCEDEISSVEYDGPDVCWFDFSFCYDAMVDHDDEMDGYGWWVVVWVQQQYWVIYYYLVVDEMP